MTMPSKALDVVRIIHAITKGEVRHFHGFIEFDVGSYDAASLVAQQLAQHLGTYPVLHTDENGTRSYQIEAPDMFVEVGW